MYISHFGGEMKKNHQNIPLIAVARGSTRATVVNDPNDIKVIKSRCLHKQNQS